jgi:sugar O-acyltransferase (sialic acid O-acetyltransferase NeuD family)
LIVVGGGGHAKVVIEVARAAGEEIAGYCDPRGADGHTLLAARWLGDDGALAALRGEGYGRAVIALGDNRRRDQAQRFAAAQGWSLAALVHPRAVVSPSAQIGAGTVIMAGAVINAATVIGEGVIVNTMASVDHDGAIGDFAHLAPGSHLAGYVTVGRGALIGVGSAVGRGRPLRIGEWARVGTGSVVIRDVPAEVTVAGNPARRIDAEGAS